MSCSEGARPAASTVRGFIEGAGASPRPEAMAANQRDRASRAQDRTRVKSRDETRGVRGRRRPVYTGFTASRYYRVIPGAARQFSRAPVSASRPTLGQVRGGVLPGNNRELEPGYHKRVVAKALHKVRGCRPACLLGCSFYPTRRGGIWAGEAHSWGPRASPGSGVLPGVDIWAPGTADDQWVQDSTPGLRRGDPNRRRLPQSEAAGSRSERA